jgi:hypothetical protein
MSDPKYAAKIEHNPDGPDDAFPWEYAVYEKATNVYESGKKLGGGIARTREEAVEKAEAFVAFTRMAVEPTVEWIDL